MHSKKLTKCALACLTCFIAASDVSAQTQRQQNNPLDQIGPAANAVDYEAPPINGAAHQVDSSQTLSVDTMLLMRVLPDISGSGVGSTERVNDDALNGMMQQLLSQTDNQPTFGQIQALTAEMSQVLRQRGHILSSVFIPAQTLRNGTLELHLLDGTLGKVTITGEASHSDEVITAAFESYKGKVVTRDNVESQLLRIQNLLPGVSALGSFRQGETLGLSDAVINVTEFNAFDGSVYLDNYGNDAVGEFRLGARFAFNNPTGWEDRLTVNLLANETPDGFDDPSNPIEKDDYQCCFGGFSYEVFSDSLMFSYGIEWSHNQYDIGNNADFALARLGFSGESNQTRLFFNYYSTLNSRLSEAWTFGMSVNRADLYARNETLGEDVLLNRDRVPEYDLGYRFTYRQNSDVYYGQVTASFETRDYHLFPIPSEWIGNSNTTKVNGIGQTVLPSRAGSDEDNAMRLGADLNAIVSSWTDVVRVKGRMAFQWTDDILAPAQQFSLAGPYGVRAYPSGSFLADRGLFASVDVEFPIAPSLDVSVFYDLGYGELNDVDPAAEFDATIQGAGVGVHYQYSDSVVVQLTASRGLNVTDGPNGEPGPNIRNGGEEVTGRDDTQVFASFIFHF